MITGVLLAALVFGPEVKLLPPDNLALSFGSSVAVTELWALVGAPCARPDCMGAAFLFRRLEPGRWDAGTILVPSDLRQKGNFGASVALQGDWAVVGAPARNGPGLSGAAYVFHRAPDATWSQVARLVSPAGQVDDRFGESVAIEEDLIAVGAFLESAHATKSGAVYVFRRTGEQTWDDVTRLVTPVPYQNGELGVSVAMSGRSLVAGAFGIGTAYVYRQTWPNSWDRGTALNRPDSSGSHLGERVAIHGDYVILGAHLDFRSGREAGAAFVYHRAADGTWDAGTRLVAPDLLAGDGLGYSVAIWGDRAVAGALKKPGKAGRAQGAVYLFTRTGESTWRTGVLVLPSDPAEEALYGASVSMWESLVLVGAPGDRTAWFDAGAAYVYKDLRGD